MFRVTLQPILWYIWNDKSYSELNFLIKSTPSEIIEITIITLKTNQWHWTTSNKCSVAELMFLVKTGWSRFSKRLSLISSKYFLFACAKMVNSSKEGLLSHYKRWSRTELSLDGFVFLKESGYIPICSLDLALKCLCVSP